MAANITKLLILIFIIYFLNLSTLLNRLAHAYFFIHNNLVKTEKILMKLHLLIQSLVENLRSFDSGTDPISTCDSDSVPNSNFTFRWEVVGQQYFSPLLHGFT